MRETAPQNPHGDISHTYTPHKKASGKVAGSPPYRFALSTPIIDRRKKSRPMSGAAFHFLDGFLKHDE
jgi:hypothetical protein